MPFLYGELLLEKFVEEQSTLVGGVLAPSPAYIPRVGLARDALDAILAEKGRYKSDVVLEVHAKTHEFTDSRRICCSPSCTTCARRTRTPSAP